MPRSFSPWKAVDMEADQPGLLNWRSLSVTMNRGRSSRAFFLDLLHDLEKTVLEAAGEFDHHLHRQTPGGSPAAGGQRGRRRSAVR